MWNEWLEYSGYEQVALMYTYIQGVSAYGGYLMKFRGIIYTHELYVNQDTVALL